MAPFLSRKSLLTQPPAAAATHFPSNCYMCYICPKDCYIQSPPLPSSDGPRLSTFLVLMLCLLILSFLILTYLTVRRYRSSLLNSPRRVASVPLDVLNRILVDRIHHPAWFVRTVGLSQSAIDSIPVIEFGKVEDDSSKKKKVGGGMLIDCPVCLSEFQDEEKIRILPECGHGFHVPCIDPWLSSHTNCPVCRAPVMIEGESIAPVEEHGGRRDEGLEIREEMGVEEIARGTTVENGDADGDSGLHAQFFQTTTRRALSMDFSSEFMMISEMSEKSNRRKPGCKNSSGRFLQKGPISMKRSFSFGGKGWKLRKSRRHHESTSS